MGDDGFKVEAVIFDLDGTLIDSMNVYYSIMRIVFEELDFPPISREEMWGAVKENGFRWAFSDFLILHAVPHNRIPRITANRTIFLVDHRPRIPANPARTPAS